MNWNMVTAIATLGYLGLVWVTLIYIRRQLDEMRRSRKREAFLSMLAELRTPEAHAARRYIYEHIPENVEGLDDAVLKEHLFKSEATLTAFSRTEYMIEEGHIDAEPLLDAYWQSIWRCWKKTKNMVSYTREKRGEPTYLRRFENLFFRALAYQIHHGHEEPRIF